MRVCKYSCDVLDSCIFLRIFLKAVEHFFCVYIASSKHLQVCKNSRKLCKPLTTSQVYRSVAALVSCYCLVIVAAVIVLGLGALFLLFVVLFTLRVSSHSCETLRQLLHHPRFT